MSSNAIEMSEKTSGDQTSCCEYFKLIASYHKDDIAFIFCSEGVVLEGAERACDLSIISAILLFLTTTDHSISSQLCAIFYHLTMAAHVNSVSRSSSFHLHKTSFKEC